MIPGAMVTRRVKTPLWSAVSNDVATDYVMRLWFYDDTNRWELFPEIAFVDQPCILEDEFYKFSLTYDDIGASIAGLVQINLLGTLDVTITSVSGDFYFGQSVLTAHGIDGAPVPEPTTMLLLASGLVGLAGFRRKFKK